MGTADRQGVCNSCLFPARNFGVVPALRAIEFLSSPLELKHADFERAMSTLKVYRCPSLIPYTLDTVRVKLVLFPI